jgi:PIN domain nuclease of toxin-antitoxin system
VSEAALDASALLALLNEEPGHETVASVISEAVISAVNLAEVVGKLADQGIADQELRRAIDALGIAVIPFDEAQAYAAGLLRPQTRRAGLSLGDRACLGLARLRKAPAYTTDRGWRKVSAGVEVRPIR